MYVDFYKNMKIVSGQRTITDKNIMKFSHTFRLIFTFVFLLALTQSNTVLAKRVDLDITTNKIRQIQVAVPSFMPALSVKGKNFAKLLGQSLAFHGIISIIPPQKYGDSQQANWRQLGADFVVLGKFQQNGNTLNLQIRLLDVASGREIMAKSLTGKPAEGRKMLFTFCDAVIQNLTGTPGIADTDIVFVGLKNKAKEVYLTDILGENFRQITRHKNITVSPRFVPNTSKLSYSSYHTGNQNLYITDLRQSKTTRALSRRKGINVAPAWSPDGRNMILTLSKYGNPDLFLLNNKGKILQQLTKRAGINVSPTWSPDGRYIVFVSDRSGRPQLYRMELSSKKTERITYDGKENVEPSWSPTEKSIAFTCLRNGVYQICTMDPFVVGESRQLTNGFSSSESPAWSPDGKQIIFSKRGGKKNQIYAMLKNGSFQRRLFSFPGSQTYPRWTRNPSF